MAMTRDRSAHFGRTTLGTAKRATIMDQHMECARAYRWTQPYYSSIKLAPPSRHLSDRPEECPETSSTVNVLALFFLRVA